MSRKTYLWFIFAIEVFNPTNPYIMKADDDIFMRVPLHLKYLEVLPRERLNMRIAVGYHKEFSDEITWHTIGYTSTLSRDVVKEIVDYEALKKLVKSEIKLRNFTTYIDFRALNEDIMVGEVIRNKSKCERLLTVNMQECHCVIHVQRALDKFVRDNSILSYFTTLQRRNISGCCCILTKLSAVTNLNTHPFTLLIYGLPLAVSDAIRSIFSTARRSNNSNICIWGGTTIFWLFAGKKQPIPAKI